MDVVILIFYSNKDLNTILNENDPSQIARDVLTWNKLSYIIHPST